MRVSRNSAVGDERLERACSTSPSNETHAHVSRRILIVSDIRFYREALAEVFARDGAFDIAGIAADADEALELSLSAWPQIVLVDAALTGGLTTVRRLAELLGQTPLVALALADQPDDVISWAEAGISGYVPRTTPLCDLARFLGEVARGKQTCSSHVAAGLLQWVSQASFARNGRQPHAEICALTPREEEVARLISSGLSNKEIARRLDIGLSTTKSHVHNVLGKLGLDRRGKVARLSRRAEAGLREPG